MLTTVVARRALSVTAALAFLVGAGVPMGDGTSTAAAPPSDLVAYAARGDSAAVLVRDRVSARGNRAPDNLDPAALSRGPNPGIAYMIRDTIRDGSRRVPAPAWGTPQALWTTAKGYVVEDRRGERARLTFVSDNGNHRVLTQAQTFDGTAASLSGQRIAWVTEADRQGVRRVVKVANPNTGQILASHRFRLVSVVAVTRTRVLLAHGTFSTPDAWTFWWNYRRDTVSRVHRQAALGADLRHDRIVFYRTTDAPFCDRVAPLSRPSHTLWRSCRFSPHQWSPNGDSTLTTHTYFDAAGTDYWATRNGTTGAALGRVTGRLDWDSAWEDNGHFLTLAQSDTGKAAVVRCTVRGRCERASRLWNVPLPDPSTYYAAPPVVLSSN